MKIMKTTSATKYLMVVAPKIDLEKVLENYSAVAVLIAQKLLLEANRRVS